MSDSAESAYSIGSADAPVGISDTKADEGVSAPKDVGAPEWYSRGYLPHRHRAGLLQSITFRLADSLPQSKLKQLEQALLSFPEQRRDVEKRKFIEQWLDAGMGCCSLRHAEVAALVQETLQHFDGDRYHLIAWVIMPNHVHVLINPLEPISKTIQGWKSLTARWILAHSERLKLGIPHQHQVWMREYWDRFIRDDKHLRATMAYIHRNPVNAGLCCEPSDWLWSSAAGSANTSVGMVNEEADEGVGAPSNSP